MNGRTKIKLIKRIQSSGGLLSRSSEKDIKPAEEWIYGKISPMQDTSIITFKCQKAFKGYQKDRVNLCKLKYYFKYF